MVDCEDVELTDGDVTALLDAWGRGDEDALPRLMEEVQDELNRIARGLFRGERRDHTLQPTAVVNELYLRFERQRRVTFHNRRELFAVAARLMRRVLVDHARGHNRAKRGGGAVHLSFDDLLGVPERPPHEILAVDEALLDLERHSPRQARIVEMRLMTGLGLEDIAAVENVSPSTVSREWRAARLFLLRQLAAGAPP